MAAERPAAILIVGVRKQVAKGISSAFAARGWTATVTEDGAEAVADARKRPYDAVVAGDGLRWMTPLELARRVLALPLKPACVLVAKPEDEDGMPLKEARAAGFGEVLRLPVEPDEVVAAVERIRASDAPERDSASASAQAPTPTSTRLHPRVPLRTLVHFQSDHDIHVDHTLNVSLGGIFIETKSLLRTGAALTLKLVLPGEGAHSILVPARVVRVQRPAQSAELPEGLGVEFMALDPEAREALVECVRAIGTEGPPLGPAAAPAPKGPPPAAPAQVQAPPSSAGARAQAKPAAPGARARARVNVAFRSPETFLKEYVRNVSFNGMFIRTPAERLLPLGTILEVRIELPQAKQSLVVKGEVVSVSKGESKSSPPGMAIQFMPECADQVRALHAFARSHRGSRRPGA